MPNQDIIGMISKAAPETYSKVLDWAARWMARLEREGLKVERQEDKGA